MSGMGTRRKSSIPRRDALETWSRRQIRPRLCSDCSSTNYFHVH